MSRVLVDSEPVSIVSEKVTETFDVIETEVSESEGELDVTVGGVVSVLFEPSSLLLLQEMMVKLKRNMDKMMSTCLTWFPISGLGKPNIYHDLGVIYKNWGILLKEVVNMNLLLKNRQTNRQH